MTLKTSTSHSNGFQSVDPMSVSENLLDIAQVY